MSSTLFVVFGNIGEGARYALRLKEADLAELVTTSSDGGYATVQMGLGDLHGPILLNSDDGEARIMVVYGGPLAPIWASSGVLDIFGWAKVMDVPQAAVPVAIELDVTVAHFGPAGATSCWSRTICVSALPRPMQRVRLNLDDDDGPGMLLHTLDVGLESHATERPIPYVVFAAPAPLSGTAMMANGWSLAQDRIEATNRLRHLAEISFGVEVYSESKFGYTVASGAEIHDKSRLSHFGLAELPRDVREAIEEAMRGKDD